MNRFTISIVLLLAATGAALAAAHVHLSEEELFLHRSQSLPVTPCENVTEFRLLNESSDMAASVGSMAVKIPYEVLFPFASTVKYWPSWNPLFVRVNVSELTLCGAFPADYTNAPKLPFPAGITGPHQIVQLQQGATSGIMAWEFKILSSRGEVITFGRHQMRFEETTNESGAPATNFVSYEKAAGKLVRPYELAWTVALQQSLIDTLIGLSCLEQVYLETGALNGDDVVAACSALPPVDLSARP